MIILEESSKSAESPKHTTPIKKPAVEKPSEVVLEKPKGVVIGKKGVLVGRSKFKNLRMWINLLERNPYNQRNHHVLKSTVSYMAWTKPLLEKGSNPLRIGAKPIFVQQC